jgi:phytoene dehydrogenase-like protein
MHGHMSLDRLWTARPLLDHGDYRSPIAGLYMCGAGTLPSGVVSGLPGHNAGREGALMPGWDDEDAVTAEVERRQT